MAGRIPRHKMLLSAFRENKPLSAKEITKYTGIEEKKVWDGLYYWWRRGLLLRSEKSFFENSETFKGRRGLRRNTRSYYLYFVRPDGKKSVLVEGQKFVPFKTEYLDIR